MIEKDFTAVAISNNEILCAFYYSRMYILNIDTGNLTKITNFPDRSKYTNKTGYGMIYDSVGNDVYFRGASFGSLSGSTRSDYVQRYNVDSGTYDDLAQITNRDARTVPVLLSSDRKVYVFCDTVKTIHNYNINTNYLNPDVYTSSGNFPAFGRNYNPVKQQAYLSDNVYGMIGAYKSYNYGRLYLFSTTPGNLDAYGFTDAEMTAIFGSTKISSISKTRLASSKGRLIPYWGTSGSTITQRTIMEPNENPVTTITAPSALHLTSNTSLTWNTADEAYASMTHRVKLGTTSGGNDVLDTTVSGNTGGAVTVDLTQLNLSWDSADQRYEKRIYMTVTSNDGYDGGGKCAGPSERANRNYCTNSTEFKTVDGQCDIGPEQSCRRYLQQYSSDLD
jgi:hypothetical protein